MSVSRTQEIEDKELSELPIYYSSMAGNIYNDRQDRSRSAKRNPLKVAKRFETVVTNFTGFNIQHGLGFKPYVVGSMRSVTNEEETFPFPFNQGVTYASIDSLTEGDITISFLMEFATSLKLVLYFLRPPT